MVDGGSNADSPAIPIREHSLVLGQSLIVPLAAAVIGANCHGIPQESSDPIPLDVSHSVARSLWTVLEEPNLCQCTIPLFQAFSNSGSTRSCELPGPFPVKAGR